MQLTLKPIVSCLNKPLSDAYIETNDNSSNPLPSAVGTSIVGGAATTLSAGSASATGSNGKNGATVVGVSKSFAAAQVLLVSLLGSLVAL